MPLAETRRGWRSPLTRIATWSQLPGSSSCGSHGSQSASSGTPARPGSGPKTRFSTLAGRCRTTWRPSTCSLMRSVRGTPRPPVWVAPWLLGRELESRRTWLDGVLADLSEGTCSVLEHGYLVRVERAHGLPRARRQRVESAGGRAVVRDVRYERYDVTVELNGRLFHDGPADWDADLERELDAAVRGAVGLRLGWGQVFSRTCRTARAVATVLRDRGWQGHPRPCHEDCSMRGFPVAAPHHVR